METPRSHRPPTTQHIPFDDLVVTDLHVHIELDTDRLAAMAVDFAAGRSWATCPLAVVKVAYGYELVDGRLRALVRQQAGETTVPVRVYDLIEDERAAFRYSGNKNRHTRPPAVQP
jgi:ParB-like chromosome segregation protein Spo0J